MDPNAPTVDPDVKNEDGVDIEPEEGKSSAEDPGVTMVDVLQDEAELEEDAKAVLGAADDKNCTYFSGGYMKRQALYACVSCTQPRNPDFKPAGICLACTYHCHEGHEIVELYTKRHFRCDCGNKRFPKDLVCKLASDKAEENQENRYNQNFRGVYCTCQRPYPDPEDPVPDSMIQCIICEDWYHGRHLKVGDDSASKRGNLPDDNSYAEMICQLCHEKFHEDFLFAYSGYSVAVVKKEETEKVNVESLARDEEVKKDEGGCILEKNKEMKGNQKDARALFMIADWRSNLCQCIKCKELYQRLEVDYLCCEEDTVHHYEAKAKDQEGSQYEEGMKALSEMDRVKQVEAIQGYNSMKANLMEYLRKFAENKKVVREEDVQEFFKNLSANKRQKVEIPKFCK